MSIDLSGVFPPIPTPFMADGSLDWISLEQNLQHLSSQPVQGIVVGGSNGEFAFLERREKLGMVSFVRERLADDRLLIAGAGIESTLGTIALTEEIAAAGAEIALVLTPHYYTQRMTPEALRNHFLTLADHAPIPVLLYNMPANTGIDMQAGTICELARHENIIGIKDSAGKLDKLAEVVQRSPPGFQVLAGSAGFFLPALSIGAVGCVAALANIAAEQVKRIETNFREGKLEAARTTQASLLRINALITSEHGVAGLKAAMDLIGLYGGPVRAPLVALPDGTREQIRAELLACGLLEQREPSAGSPYIPRR